MNSEGIARRSKDNYYLDIAETVSERSTCLRRRFGAIIVKNDVIVSTGYTVLRADAPTATNSGYATVKSSAFRAEKDMSFAARSIRRQMR